MSWTPDSWRARPVRAQLPAYPDARALAEVESCLSAAAPLIEVADAMLLRERLAEVAEGRRFLLQGGDCAETFAEFGADKVRQQFNLILQMAQIIHTGSDIPVVKVARMAGQFAKPRSADTETIGDLTLPSYRGDIVNGPAFDATSRAPDPFRMLEAYRQSQVTIDLLDAYSAAAYADLSELHRSARRRLGLAFEHAQAPGDLNRPVHMFTSHEALLLQYEQALTRWDDDSEAYWALSGHMIWIGDRTRQLDGAHVHYAAGVRNAVGIKCGPSLPAGDLLRLLDAIDPANDAGRLVLIGRFGADKAAEHLPRLMRATQAAGRKVVWSIDPMHGNTVTVADRKTRRVADILSEIGTFFEAAAAEGVHPGGVHLEMTGANVTECLGGSALHGEEELGARYLTHCDPRLNAVQALDIAGEFARLLAPHAPNCASHAA